MGSFLTELIRLTGAVGAAAIAVTPPDEGVRAEYEERIAKGYNGTMGYLQNYPEIRFDPSRLTDPEARTLISVAFNCHFNEIRASNLPQIASYALGEDYHSVLRKRIENATEAFKEAYGGVWRICIDSAPVMERYWAVRSGLATRCINSMVAVPGFGQKVLLAEILTDIPIEELTSGAGTMSIAARKTATCAPSDCTQCNRCVSSCPTGAILSDGGFIAKRCVNYLTIERRGEWDEVERGLMEGLKEPGSIYGCDICRDVCPMNRNLEESEIEELRPGKRLLELTAGEILEMGSGEFRRVFGKSAAFRTGLSAMKRNARQTKNAGGTNRRHE